MCSPLCSSCCCWRCCPPCPGRPLWGQRRPWPAARATSAGGRRRPPPLPPRATITAAPSNVRSRLLLPGPILPGPPPIFLCLDVNTYIHIHASPLSQIHRYRLHTTNTALGSPVKKPEPEVAFELGPQSDSPFEVGHFSRWDKLGVVLAMASIEIGVDNGHINMHIHPSSPIERG